jgi:thiol:disulfide interchange protein DsbD
MRGGWLAGVGVAALLCVAVAGNAGAQTDATTLNPIKWAIKAQLPTTPLKAGDTFTAEVTATIDRGWHLYSTTPVERGPRPTRFAIVAGQGFEIAGAIKAPDPFVGVDANFGVEVEYYEESVTFTVPVRVTPRATTGRPNVTVQVRYQSCNDRFCLPPTLITLEAPVDTRMPSAAAPATAAPSAAGASPPPAAAVPSDTAPTPAAAPKKTASAPASVPAPPSGATPAAAPSGPVTPAPGQPQGSLWSFIWLAMSVGALSLLTPCVFPMVPITVSYFTSHAAGSRGKAVQQAVAYMVGIILTFTALGMAMALLVGATSLNRFAASPWVNILITGIFLAFALSLFGVFDLGLPSALVNRLDGLTRRQGGSQTLATLLMGLTFTLTSFTCTSPFIGTLLVVAAGGDWQWPLVGMLAFSTVFALPFFVLALMPQWMASLPRSGGWLNSVKVLMAFLEVAAAMKFLSNVDLIWGWGIFTHDVVLASWVVIFVMMALYVLGLFRFAHDAPVTHVGIGRLTTALVCGTIGLWLVTGLAGKPLGELEAFLPPPPDSLKSGIAVASASNELPWIMNDYPQALAKAKREGKRVFIDFTGYTCTNCRWMEANMFPRDEVRRELGDFVLVRLYTDGDGEIFERQQRLQQEKYRTVALPFYAVVNADGSPVANFPGLTRDVDEFVAFLRSGKS